MMRTKDEEIKQFSIRVPKSMWNFLRKYSFDKGTTMNEVIVKHLDKLIKKEEK